jgi:hypothetical protein
MYLLLIHNYCLLVNFKASAYLHLQHLFLYNNLLITSGIFSPGTKQYYRFPEVCTFSGVLIGVSFTSSDHIFQSKKWLVALCVCVYAWERERESTYMAACFSHIWWESECLAIVSTLLNRVWFVSLLSYNTLSCEKTTLWLVCGCTWFVSLSYKWL